MRIAISIVSSDRGLQSDLISLDVGADMTLNDIKALVEAEIDIPTANQIFLKDGRPVSDTSITLNSFGAQEGDLIYMAIQSTAPRRRPAETAPTGEPSAQRQRAAFDPEQLRLRMVGDRTVMAEIERQDPELAAAASDPQKFHQRWNMIKLRQEQIQREKEEQLALLQADPFNVDAQRKIEEMIRLERVSENHQKAMEEFPEAFGRVTMLYIDVVVNGIPIKAFVDSGAQTTIMSPEAAERCGLMRLVDDRFGGVARGVGTAKILGRVHAADIQIGQYNLASSFTVMEGKDVDLLFGLDMLKRHQMCIDLKKNCLRIEEDEIPFLPESELPKMMDTVLDEEPKVAGPGGSTIGATTGTVLPGSSKPSTGESKEDKSTSTQPSTSQAQTSRAAGLSSSQPATGAGDFQPRPITPELIAQVTAMGFSREEAVAALEQAGGNVELAVGLLTWER